MRQLLRDYRVGECIRGGMLFMWALWLGLFARFEESRVTLDAFIQLSSNEWMWAVPFMIVGLAVILTAIAGTINSRLAAGFLLVMAMGWVTGGFAFANWHNGAVVVWLGLTIYAAISVLRISSLRT